MTELKDLPQALAKFQAAHTKASKDSKSNFGRFASLLSVLEAVSKGAEFGLSHSTILVPVANDHHHVTSTLMHTSGEKIISTIAIANVEGRNDMQELGKRITYARRYLLISLYGLAPGEEEDDDCDSLTKAEPVKQAPKPRAKKAPAPKPPADQVEFFAEKKAEVVAKIVDLPDDAVADILSAFKSHFKLKADNPSREHITTIEHVNFLKQLLSEWTQANN